MLYIYHACCVSMPLSWQNRLAAATAQMTIAFSIWGGAIHIEGPFTMLIRPMNGREFFRCLMYNLLVHVCVFLSYYLDSNVLGRPCYDYRSASEHRLVRARGRCKSYARGLRCLICCTYEKLAAEQELSGQISALALHWQICISFLFPLVFSFLCPHASLASPPFSSLSLFPSRLTKELLLLLLLLSIL